MEGRRSLYKEECLKRRNRLSLLLNNREMKALGIYCNRYRIKNKSEFLRETIMKAIIKRFDEEHPTLWEESEPTLFNPLSNKLRGTQNPG
jgi:hypothetical protein